MAAVGVADGIRGRCPAAGTPVGPVPGSTQTIAATVLVAWSAPSPWLLTTWTLFALLGVALDAARMVVGWQITGISYRKARKAEKGGLKIKFRVRLKTSEGEDLPVDLDSETVAVLRAWRVGK